MNRELIGALATVTRKAGALVAAEEDFRAAVIDAHDSGASLRDIEAASRWHELVGDRRGFTHERMRGIVNREGE